MKTLSTTPFIALTTEDGLPSNRVIRIDEDEEGTVWIFTESGLAQWKDGRLIRVAPAPGSPFNDSLDDPRKYLGTLRTMGAAGMHGNQSRHHAHPPRPPS